MLVHGQLHLIKVENISKVDKNLIKTNLMQHMKCKKQSWCKAAEYILITLGCVCSCHLSLSLSIYSSISIYFLNSKKLEFFIIINIHISSFLGYALTQSQIIAIQDLRSNCKFYSLIKLMTFWGKKLEESRRENLYLLIQRSTAENIKSISPVLNLQPREQQTQIQNLCEL